MSVVGAIRGMVMPVPTPFLEDGEVDDPGRLLSLRWRQRLLHQRILRPGARDEHRAEEKTAELAVQRIHQRKPDWEQATLLQVKILEYIAATDPLFSAFGRSSQCEALRIRGFNIQRFPRWPARPLTEEARAILRASLEKLGIPLGI